MAEPETKTKTSTSIILPDWCQLPEELLHIISEKLMDHCFDVVHARSVCRLWRSVFTFPTSLLRPSCSLPMYPLESKVLRTLEKVPLFLFRVLPPPVAAMLPSEYFLGTIGRDESEDHMELPSTLQCSVKVKIPDFEPTLINTLDCQIFPLGHEYRMNGCKGVAFLPLNNENGGGGFVVLLNYHNIFLVLTSADMRWKQLKNIPNAIYSKLVTFRGRFYVTFLSGKTFAINPYSLEVTLLFPLPEAYHLFPLPEAYHLFPLPEAYHYHYLVPSDNDELFLVEPNFGVSYRVSRLDEEAGKWVEVSDLGDRVLFIGQQGNVSCLAKELPHGCGLSGNSILFTNGPGNVTFPYKYGVHTGNAEDDLNCWRSSMENRVLILNNSSRVMALSVNP